ncbi:hypothetical protein D3C75_669530 [compost metagenome]
MARPNEFGDKERNCLTRPLSSQLFNARPSLLANLQHFNARKWHKGLYDTQPKSLKQTVGDARLIR